jgi:hypothetical protein
MVGGPADDLSQLISNICIFDYRHVYSILHGERTYVESNLHMYI